MKVEIKFLMDCKSIDVSSTKACFVCCRFSRASARSWRSSPSQRTVSTAFNTRVVIVLRPRIDVPKGETTLASCTDSALVGRQATRYFSISACLKCAILWACCQRCAHLAPLVFSESRRVSPLTSTPKRDRYGANARYAKIQWQQQFIINL